MKVAKVLVSHAYGIFSLKTDVSDLQNAEIC